MIKRIHVAYRLRAAPGVDRAAIERVMGFHVDRCPVARSIKGCIDISTDIEVTEE